jgi:ubiquinone/menaquinone biosynthesis C-methylase UbiE
MFNSNTLPRVATATQSNPFGLPLCTQLISHGFAQLPQRRQRAIERAYRAMPGEFFDAMEREIAYTVLASGGSFEDCLQDLTAFNALRPEAENDAWYDQKRAFISMHLDAVQLGFSHRRLMCTAQQVFTHAAAARQVLEVGSGSGRLAATMADLRCDLHFTLVDRSASAVRFASALHNARGTGRRVRSVRGDMQALPAADASMDLVIAAEVLGHAPNPQQSVTELLRVLRPGGWLAISLPIHLDIAMHPTTVFANEAEILAFFANFGLQLCASEVVKPDAEIDAIADVLPGFVGCVNAVFRKI